MGGIRRDCVRKCLGSAWFLGTKVHEVLSVGQNFGSQLPGPPHLPQAAIHGWASTPWLCMFVSLLFFVFERYQNRRSSRRGDPDETIPPKLLFCACNAPEIMSCDGCHQPYKSTPDDCKPMHHSNTKCSPVPSGTKRLRTFAQIIISMSLLFVLTVSST